MKKIILSLFLLVAVVMSPVFYAQEASAQSSSTNTNTVGCTIINVPPILKFGSKGSEVTKFQTFLKAWGYLNVNPTGFYGILTRKAAIQFQLDYGLNPDGMVGKITAAFIKNLTCVANAQNLNAGNVNPNASQVAQNNQAQNQNQNQQAQNQIQQNTAQQNQQQNQQQQNIGVTQNLTAPCVANVTAPFVEVDSPNGGEIFTNTDMLKIGWSTCNLPVPDTKMRVTLLHLNDVVMTADVLNTGSHTFVLTPALIMNPPVPPVQPIAFDKLFKVQVTAVAVNGAPTDMSDNTFAILDAGLNPNNPGPVAPNAPLNPNQGWPLGCIWPLTVVNNLNGIPCVNPVVGNVPNNGPTVAADVCAASPLPHVVVFKPNGGEKFVIGDMMDVVWFNCNVPAGVDIQISLVQTTNTGTVSYVLVKQTPNDNFEQVKLVPLPGSPALVPGDNYQVRLDFVITPAYTGPANPAWLHWGVDLSDAFFTLVQ